ncbi:MAG: 3-oxoacyl-[acyl-carrier-protein] reductase, partial [Gammaproteobacteria bacterium]
MTKKVLITAAAGGIGKAIAQSFLDEGDKVYICDIAADAVEKMVSSHPSLGGCVADLSKQEDVKRFIEQGLEYLGGVDVLINNAGVAGQRGPVEELDYESWESTF